MAPLRFVAATILVARWAFSLQMPLTASRAYPRRHCAFSQTEYRARARLFFTRSQRMRSMLRRAFWTVKNIPFTFTSKVWSKYFSVPIPAGGAASDCRALGSLTRGESLGPERSNMSIRVDQQTGGGRLRADESEFARVNGVRQDAFASAKQHGVNDQHQLVDESLVQ